MDIKKKMIEALKVHLEKELKEMPYNSTKFSDTIIGIADDREFQHIVKAKVVINKDNIYVSDIRFFMSDRDYTPLEPIVKLSMQEIINACKGVVKTKRTGSVTGVSVNTYNL